MRTFAVAAIWTGLAITLAGGSAQELPAQEWVPTTWNDERAFVSQRGSWRAIVSVDRGRLIYFGATNDGPNLLYAPKTRDDPAGWGGHRLWLGPQTDWRRGWPPPAGWDKRAPEKVELAGASLRLLMEDVGNGWPRLTREYFWQDGRLHCRAHITGGTRCAQIIQILQIPPQAIVGATATPTAATPHGYVQLHMGRHPSPQPVFAAPPHVTASGRSLRLKFLDVTEKFGFLPQPLTARLGDFELQLEAGPSKGSVVSTPDDGFVTQVYLGSRESQLIELEQLSPIFAAPGDASFEIVIAGTAD